MIEYNETYKFSNSMYDYIQEANNLIKHKEYQAPFWIVSLILEELPDLPIDDSDGTTSYVESECIEVIEKILNKCKSDNIKNEIHYGTVIYYIEELLSIYIKLNQKEKYKNLVKDTLFKYSRASFKYYKKLKELYTEEQWKNKRDSIIKELESDGEGYHRDDLRQIYIEEQYYDKLYNSVITTPLFEIIVRYEKYLKKDFEKQLLEEYQKIVDEKSKFTGKKNYEDIRKILQHMKTLKNGKKLVEKMGEEYKIRYANRRLMLEKLNEI